MNRNWFASSIVEERVVARGGRFVTELSRFDRGWARSRLRSGWIEIDAGDTSHARGMPDPIASLLASPYPDLPDVGLEPEAHGGWRFHAVVRRRVAVDRGSMPAVHEEQFIVANAPTRDHGHVSIVSAPRSLGSDVRRLAETLARPPAHGTSPDTFPIAFSNGSAAVLLHEAAGHPAERNAPHVAWPSWLEVTDNPADSALGALSFDDCGRPVTLRVLTRGESPSALRRWSFRDTPIVRMSNLRVSASGAPVALPSPRVEVHYVEHGSWDPLHDEVSLRVSVAELVIGRERALLPRFTLHATRRQLASRFAGWFGETTTYPGVICSDEGQALPVGSIATGILLLPR